MYEHKRNIRQRSSSVSQWARSFSLASPYTQLIMHPHNPAQFAQKSSLGSAQIREAGYTGLGSPLENLLMAADGFLFIS
jgi:hypothetical protein